MRIVASLRRTRVALCNCRSRNSCITHLFGFGRNTNGTANANDEGDLRLRGHVKATFRLGFAAIVNRKQLEIAANRYSQNDYGI